MFSCPSILLSPHIGFRSYYSLRETQEVKIQVRCTCFQSSALNKIHYGLPQCRPTCLSSGSVSVLLMEGIFVKAAASSTRHSNTVGFSRKQYKIITASGFLTSHRNVFGCVLPLLLTVSLLLFGRKKCFHLHLVVLMNGCRELVGQPGVQSVSKSHIQMWTTLSSPVCEYHNDDSQRSRCSLWNRRPQGWSGHSRLPCQPNSF